MFNNEYNSSWREIITSLWAALFLSVAQVLDDARGHIFVLRKIFNVITLIINTLPWLLLTSWLLHVCGCHR